MAYSSIVTFDTTHPDIKVKIDPGATSIEYHPSLIKKIKIEFVLVDQPVDRIAAISTLKDLVTSTCHIKWEKSANNFNSICCNFEYGVI